MSKLDDILDTSGVNQYEQTVDEKEFKQAIKDLMLELIGENLEQNAKYDESTNWARKALNDYRDELRQKVEEL